MRKIILLLVLAVLLVSCLPASAPRHVGEVTSEVDMQVVYDEGSWTIGRFVDLEYGKVCYIYSGLEKGGIACEPLESE